MRRRLVDDGSFNFMKLEETQKVTYSLKAPSIFLGDDISLLRTWVVCRSVDRVDQHEVQVEV